MGLLDFSRHLDEGVAHQAVPWVSSLGALVPALAQRRDLHELGFQLGPARHGLRLPGLCALGTLTFGALGVSVLDRLSIKPPLAGVVPTGQWPAWVLFQFGFAALPEELFSRRYFLTNCVRLLGTMAPSRSWTAELSGVCLSAGAFAVVHVLTLGETTSLLTFFPGFVFAWLFLRRRSLLPPVLLHGAANIGYVLLFASPV
jgi:membrane protease YdiL (CAAX protease family)